MNAVPTPVIVLTLLSCVLVIIALAAVGYVAAADRGAGPRTALNVAVAVAAILAAWLVAAAAIGGGGLFAAAATGQVVPPIAAGLLVPIVVGVLLARIPTLRDALSPPRVLALLTAVNVWRVFGLVFVVLVVQDRLPAQFGLPAGIGDVLVGLAAPVAAWTIWRHPDRRRPGIVFHTLGLLDLVMAAALGVLSAPGALQVFAGEPDTSPITALPLVLVPAFLVPLFVVVHLVSLRILARRPSWEASHRAPATARPHHGPPEPVGARHAPVVRTERGSAAGGHAGPAPVAPRRAEPSTSRRTGRGHRPHVGKMGDQHHPRHG